MCAFHNDYFKRHSSIYLRLAVWYQNYMGNQVGGARNPILTKFRKSHQILRRKPQNRIPSLARSPVKSSLNQTVRFIIWNGLSDGSPFQCPHVCLEYTKTIKFSYISDSIISLYLSDSRSLIRGPSKVGRLYIIVSDVKNSNCLGLLR